MNNIKYYSIKLFFCISLAVIALSCKDNEEDLSFRTYDHTVAPNLLSASPSDNSVVSSFTDSVLLVFDKNVTVADLSKIKLNGNAIENFEEKEDAIILKFEGLLEGTDYTLLIPKGSVKGIPGTLNTEDITIHFKTEGSLKITENLVMPNASSEAKKVYAFLIENYRKKIISGTVAKINWNIDEAERVYGWTGKYPAMNTFDYIHHYGNWINYTDVSVVENWWNNKGLVSAMWHWSVPATNGSSEMAFYYTGRGGSNTETSFDITKAVEEGTSENAQVKSDLNTIANYLLALQAKKIPVIWRPLHEAAGGWFWWGAKGSDAYKKLWIMMFDTFKAKGVNNLIWVWTTETNDPEWYPGDAYVDIIGRDIYNKTDASSIFNDYWNIRKSYPNKMIALSECGSVANVTDQWNAGAQWSWFMPWYDTKASGDLHSHAGKDFWENAFASDIVITRENMPDLK